MGKNLLFCLFLKTFYNYWKLGKEEVVLDQKTLRKLEKTRSLLIRTGLKYGFHNQKTLLVSQRLDEIINQYYSKYSFPK